MFTFALAGLKTRCEPLPIVHMSRSSTTPPRSRTLAIEEQKQVFHRLCTWIEEHLDEPIGWQELMRESGLEFQVIHQLFFQYTSTSPMTWIRRRRETRCLPELERNPSLRLGDPQS